MLSHIRRFITALFYRLFSPQYRTINESGLFDHNHYLEDNPDVSASGIDPLAHYLRKGHAEHRNPGALFDHGYYLHQISERDDRGKNLLLHYLEGGWKSGIKPNILVDPEYYSMMNADYDSSTIDPLTHFLKQDVASNSANTPSPYFDTCFYCSNYADAKRHLHDPKAAYVHYLRIGLKENRQPSVYFDPAYYLEKYSLLGVIDRSSLNHYVMFGSTAKKSPSPLFDPLFYSERYDVTDCDDLFAHYLRSTIQEDRQPCSWFNPEFYRNNYLAEIKDLVSPLKHFLEIGLKNQYYPNEDIASLPVKPVISVLVPVYNVKSSYLNNCIRSVLYQSYPHWELCLVDDCSSASEIQPLLKEWSSLDSRIKVGFLPENKGISAATNAAAELASGSYLAFLDNDDELAADALQTFATWINRYPADLYYSDEDLIGDDGRQFSIFRKPAFNRELLLCHNYVNHCVLTERSLFEKVGKFDDKMNGAQDHDLFLRLSEEADNIVHIPQILYHWRASATSTSINHGQKHYADEAGRRSVENALTRKGETGDALFTDLKFFYRARRRIKQEVAVSLVINWEGGESDIVDCLVKVLNSAGHQVSQLVVLLTQQPEDSLVEEISQATGIEIVCRIAPKHLGLTTRLQFIDADITSDLVAFVNGDLEIVGEDWLAALVEYGQYPEFGLIAGRVDYPNEFYDLVTSLPDCSSSSPFYYYQFLTNCSVFMNGRQCCQQVVVTTSDFFLVRHDLLQLINGTDHSKFPYLFALADFSIQLHKLGKKNIYTPHCRAVTNVNKTICPQKWPEAEVQDETIRFQGKWGDFLHNCDLFYNPGLIPDNGLSPAEFKKWMTGTA